MMASSTASTLPDLNDGKYVCHLKDNQIVSIYPYKSDKGKDEGKGSGSDEGDKGEDGEDGEDDIPAVPDTAMA